MEQLRLFEQDYDDGEGDLEILESMTDRGFRKTEDHLKRLYRMVVHLEKLIHRSKE